jgi:plastocyanin
LAYASVASAAATEIQVNDDFFAPDNPPVRNLSSGASFHWSRAPGSFAPHNIRQDSLLFRSGALTSGPINFSIRASAGTYHYYCELHYDTSTGTGMDGVVKVRPIHSFSPAGAPFTVTWALGGTSPTNTGNQFDVQYRIGTTTTWKVWKNDTSARSGVFGQNGQPVQVLSGRTYQFRARSQKSTNPSKPSGWSPIRQVNT